MDYPKTLIDSLRKRNNHGNPRNKSCPESKYLGFRILWNSQGDNFRRACSRYRSLTGSKRFDLLRASYFPLEGPNVTITAKAMKGVGKRILAGLPVYVTEAHGPGRIAIQSMPFHLSTGE